MNQDSKLMNFFSRISDLLLLNFLFVITSLPIVTLGASITALYSVNLKMVRNEESYVMRDYFRAFRNNFKIATIGFFFLSLIESLMLLNIWISFQNNSIFYLFLRSCSTILLAILLICEKYFFPILARFQFTTKQIWMHIPHMITTQFRSFFFLLLINVPLIILIVYSIYTAAFVLLIGCLIGFSVFTYIESILFRTIFQPYELS